MKHHRDSSATKKARKLKQHFPELQDDVRLDKDLHNITDPHAVGERTFFLGELFWVEREGWRGCGGFYTNETRNHHPGLVVKRQRTAYSPVEMVPGSSKLRETLDDGGDASLFSPSKPLLEGGSNSHHIEPDEQFFVLDYRRPVSRCHIAGLLGRLDHADACRLQGELREV